MTRLPDTETVQHRFPMGNTTLHVRTIPGCVAVGMKEYASAETGVGAWYDLALPVCCTRDGLPSRGAALILAFIDLPDLATPLTRISVALERMVSGRGPVTAGAAADQPDAAQDSQTPAPTTGDTTTAKGH